MPRLGAEGRLMLAAAQRGVDLGEHRGFRRRGGEPAAAAAGAAHHDVAEIGTEAIGAAKQFAVVQDAEAEAVLDVDDQKIVEVARLAEPMFGERDEIDVAVDRDRRRPSRLRQVGAEVARRARAKIGLCRQTPAARSTTPGRPTQMPAIFATFQSSASLTQRRTPSSTRSAMTAAGLPIDADRQRQACAARRRRNW